MRSDVEAMAKLMEFRMGKDASIWDGEPVAANMKALRAAVVRLDLGCAVEDIPKVAADVAMYAMLFARHYGLEMPQYNPALEATP